MTRPSYFAASDASNIYLERTAAVADGRAYVGADDDTLYAITPRGEVRSAGKTIAKLGTDGQFTDQAFQIAEVAAKASVGINLVDHGRGCARRAAACHRVDDAERVEEYIDDIHDQQEECRG